MFELTKTAIAASLLVVTAGCFSGNPKTYPVRGKVTFPDGKPLTKGTVEFEALDREKPITATGEISEDGTFVLGTFAMDDGTLAGRHRAVVIADHEIGTGAERPGLIAPTPLDPRFRDYKTSGLEFTVKPEKNEINILVDYAPRGRE